MLSKNRNILLFVILIIVVAIYWWSSQSDENPSNYRTVLLEFDSAAVDQIKIIPPTGTLEFTLDRSEKGWSILGVGTQFTADKKIVERTLGLLNGIAVKRMASQNASLHDQFSVTPDKGTRVELFSNGKLVGDLMLGKFDYFQPQNAQPDARGRQPQGEMVFYAAIPGEPAVYVIDGQIGFGIGKEISAYRDKTLVNLDKSNIREVIMETPGQKTDRLVKDGNQWLFNNQVADSAKVAQYLSRVSRQNGSNFGDIGQVSGLPLASAIQITGDGFDRVLLQSFQQDSVNFLVTSTQNTEGVFLDNGNKLLDRLIEGGDFFFKGK